MLYDTVRSGGIILFFFPSGQEKNNSKKTYGRGVRLGDIRNEECDCEKGTMILTWTFLYLYFRGCRAHREKSSLRRPQDQQRSEEATQDQLSMFAVDNSVVFIS